MKIPFTRYQPAMDYATLTTVSNNNFATLETVDFNIIVGEGVTNLGSAGSPTSFVSIEHNLDYTPVVDAYINNATIGGITTSGSLKLPTWTNLFVDVPNGQVKFLTYLQAIPDSQFVHFVMSNATGLPVPPVIITYYLYKQRAA